MECGWRGPGSEFQGSSPRRQIRCRRCLPAQRQARRGPRSKWESSIGISLITVLFLILRLILSLVLVFLFVSVLAVWRVLHATERAETANALQLAEVVHADGAEDEHDGQFLGFDFKDEHAVGFAVYELDHDVGGFSALLAGLANDR